MSVRCFGNDWVSDQWSTSVRPVLPSVRCAKVVMPVRRLRDQKEGTETWQVVAEKVQFSVDGVSHHGCFFS